MMLFACYKWGVFLCHVSEDKETIVDSFYTVLNTHVKKVWYDKYCIEDWDYIEEEIFNNLPKSRVLVVILSKALLMPDEESSEGRKIIPKKWPWTEMGNFLSNKRKRKYILPLRYDLTIDELKQLDIPDFLRTKSIPLLDSENVNEKALNVLKKVKKHRTRERNSKIFLFFILPILSLIFITYSFQTSINSSQGSKTIPLIIRVIDNEGHPIDSINLTIDKINYFIPKENFSLNIPNHNQNEISIEYYGDEIYSPIARRIEINTEKNILPTYVIFKRPYPLSHDE